MKTIRRSGHFALSVATLGAMAAVPWALLRWVGWPLPTVVPSGTQLSLALRSADVPDMLVIKTLACVTWVAWADLILAFAWELAVNHPRLARGRPPRRSVLVNRWMAGLASYVVAGLLTVATVAGPASATPLARPAVAHMLAPEPTARPLAMVRVASPPTVQARVPTTGDPTWVAQRGDTLWNIAEITTGDPNRFAEIIALNPDQLVRSRDLRAGMVLRLPAGAQVPEGRRSPSPPAVEAPGPTRTHLVTPGESEWSIAQEEVPGEPAAVVAPVWTEIVADNTATVRDPNLIYPGQTLVVPATAATQTPAPTPAPTSPPTPVPPAANPPRAPAPAPLPPPSPTAAPASAPPRSPSEAHGRSHVASPLSAEDRTWALGAGGVLLAAGVGAELVLRRRRGMARRRPGARPLAIPERLEGVARQVASARVDDAQWLAAELRLMCASVPVASRAAFGVTVVQYNPQHAIELALISPIVDPPAGWDAQAGGLVWTLTEPHSAEELADALDLPPALPALVAIGEPDGEGQILLNVEQAGLVGVEGDPAMVMAIVRAMVWELATTPLSEHVQVVGLGVDVPGAAELDHWSTVGSVEEMVEVLADAARETEALLASRAETVVEARCRGRDAVVPTVGVVTHDKATVEVLSSVGPGVVLIVVGATPAGALAVRIADGQVSVPALGLLCSARQLSAELASAMGDLLANAAAPPVARPADRPPDPPVTIEAPDGDEAANRPKEQTSADPWAWLPPEPRVMLRLLGPVGTEGAELTPQQIAALTFLAMHRDPAPTTAQIKDALWAGEAPKPKRWRDFLYQLRLAVGPGVVVEVDDDRLGLTPDVGTDINLVQALLTHAEEHTTQRWECLERAVDQLRGVPFTYPPTAARYWRWVDSEYLDARLYARLAEAATDLGRHYLGAGQATAARDVAERGLRALPIDSALTELLMDAYAALGSTAAAERVYDAHERALDDLGLSGASEETQAVIEAIRAAANPTALSTSSAYSGNGTTGNR